MRRLDALLLLFLLAAGAETARAQAIHAATSRQISITAGGTASIFQPDFADSWTFVCTSSCTPLSTSPAGYYSPVAQASNQPLFGVGAYVDVKLARWVQFEAEGRWQRFNKFDGISQDNYLIGPRLPLYHFWKAEVYGKALGGVSKMHFDTYGDHGSFTSFAFGGGMDVKLTKRLSWRAADFEYQYWPWWGNSTIAPYGASMGLGYKIF
jgi:hypothetical protein